MKVKLLQLLHSTAQSCNPSNSESSRKLHTILLWVTEATLKCRLPGTPESPLQGFKNVHFNKHNRSFRCRQSSRQSAWRVPGFRLSSVLTPRMWIREALQFLQPHDSNTSTHRVSCLLCRLELPSLLQPLQQTLPLFLCPWLVRIGGTKQNQVSI